MCKGIKLVPFSRRQNGVHQFYVSIHLLVTTQKYYPSHKVREQKDQSKKKNSFHVTPNNILPPFLWNQHSYFPESTLTHSYSHILAHTRSKYISRQAKHAAVGIFMVNSLESYESWCSYFTLGKAHHTKMTFYKMTYISLLTSIVFNSTINNKLEYDCKDKSGTFRQSQRSAAA